MKVFVDSGIWTAALLERDKYHESASQILSDILRKYKYIYVSDWIVDEVVSFLGRKRWQLVQKAVRTMQESGKVEILNVYPALFASAKVCLEQYPEHNLTLTDWTSLILMKENEIEEMASVAREFERVRSIREFAFVTPIIAWPKS